jgi:hypothetical protein
MKTAIKPTVTPSTSTATSSAAKSASSPSAAVPPQIANIPSVTTAEVDALVSAIDTFANLLGANFVVPQPKEAKRMAKPRKAAPTIVPLVADLSTRYSVASTAYPTSVTLAQQALVNTLGPVAERIGAVQKLVNAVISVGQSAAWEGSMVTYGLLKSEARGNAVLGNALVPVRDKLRPTYDTADGGKTKVRSRSKSATAKGATAKGAATAATPAPAMTTAASASATPEPPPTEAAPQVQAAATPAANANGAAHS